VSAPIGIVVPIERGIDMDIADASDVGGTPGAQPDGDRSGREDAPTPRRATSPGVIASASLAAAGTGFVVSQIQMVVYAEGSLSFWGFAIYFSVLFALAIGIAVAIGGALTALVARFVRATGRAGVRAVVRGASVAVLAWGVLGIVIATTEWMRNAAILFWPTWLVSVAVGSLRIGIPVWHRRADGSAGRLSGARPTSR